MDTDEKKYYIIKDGEQCGPYPLSQLMEQGVCPDTPVWCKGMDRWKRARDVGDVCRLYRQHITALMHPTAVATTEDNAASKPDANDYEEVPMRLRYPMMKGETPVEMQPEQEPKYDVQPPNLILPAIVVMVLCCLPTGIIGLYYAIRCQRVWKRGDKVGAYEQLRRAKLWIGITFFLGFLVWATVIKLLSD